LENLIKSTKGKVEVGGEVNIEDRWVSPTLVLDVPKNDILMQDEIFGPILPVVLVKGSIGALEFIRARGEKPLAIYVFSEDPTTQRLFAKSTSSGAVSINDCIYYAGVEDLPFGGVGNSGMGHKYHGYNTFLAFTHEKGCLVRKLHSFSEFITQ
jgi:aldehyde dehydrogenase (NAD+)